MFPNNNKLGLNEPKQYPKKEFSRNEDRFLDACTEELNSPDLSQKLLKSKGDTGWKSGSDLHRKNQVPCQVVASASYRVSAS